MDKWKYSLCGAALLVSLPLNTSAPVLPKEPEPIVQAAPKAVVSSSLQSLAPSQINSINLPILPPILLKIADCESGERDKNGRAIPGTAKQFNKDGSVVRGEENPEDIGKWQINLYWNGEKAKELGYDLFTEEGNTRMTLYLYKQQGTGPWLWSKSCWG